MTNPLLDKQHLPPFDKIRAEHVLPALTIALDSANAKIIELEKLADQATWHSFASELEKIDVSLDNIWSTVSHLNSVMDSSELRDAYQEGQQLLTAFHTSVAQNLALYQGYKNRLARIC